MTGGKELREALERLRRYAAHPGAEGDSPEQVEAFLRRMETIRPAGPPDG